MERRPPLPRLLVAGATALLAGLALPAAGTAASCPQGASSTAPGALRFGIYPGGPAGSVNPTATARPEDPVRRLAALRELAGTSPFVVRLYSAWTGDAVADDPGGWLDGDVASYLAAGLQVELVVRYKPAAPDPRSSPPAFADYVRAIVRRYGASPGFVSLQVTNEANLAGAPAASDGAFPGAVQALVAGVVAAKDQARRDARAQLRVGFSWAYDERPQAGRRFWAALRRAGGRAFASAVDWVGLDSYPGTWAPQLPSSGLLPGSAAIALQASVRTLHDCLMPLAGLRGGTALHVAENGFPTGPGRSDALQAQMLDAMVRCVAAIRQQYGITDYRWFDLRDSATADPSLESQYGITRDDYSPKPAFAAYRDLVGRFGGAAAPRARAASSRTRRRA